MSATDELFDITESIFNGEVTPEGYPVELIIMRDSNKANVAYNDSRETNRQRKKLSCYNEMLMGTEITGAEIGPMVRIFNEAWSRGGRAYGLWQNVPEVQRRNFLIAGKPTVELDYRAIHPSILYSEKGLPLPSDCYEIDDCERDQVKLALLILINSNTLKTCTLALAAEYENKARAALGDQMLSTTDEIPEHRITEASRIIEAVKKHHKPIADSFHSSAGVRLQNIDSAIAEAVWWTMYKRGILVLPIHDSFIVEIEHAALLENIMKEAAKELTGAQIQVDFKA